MQQQKQEQFSEQDIIEEEDVKSQEELQRSFRQISFTQKSQSEHQNNTVYTRQIIKPLEMMFIIFSVYKEDLITLAAENNCRIKISMNKVKIRSSSTEEDFQICCSNTIKYLDNIIYEQLTLYTRELIYNSPYFVAEASKQKIGLTKFNNKIYIHSNCLDIEKLKQLSNSIFKGKNIFTVKFKSIRHKNRQIYDHFRQFLKTIINKHKQQFNERKVIVQIDRQENGLNCIGEKQRQILAAKNILKNVLGSAVVLIFKYNIPSQDINKKLNKAKTYSQNISTYPIYFNKFMKTSAVIISKQNILKSLLKKKKLFQYMGLSGQNTEIGMFLLRNYKYHQKKQLILQICYKKGYDFTNFNSGVCTYFKKIFLQDEEKGNNIEQVINLVIQILQQLQKSKEKFDVPEMKKAFKKQFLEIQVNEGEYYETGQIQQDKFISDKLKRTVLSQKLKMSKPNLVKYNIHDGEEESPIYWFEKNGEKTETNYNDFKVGTCYFKGRRKSAGRDKIYFYENKLSLI